MLYDYEETMRLFEAQLDKNLINLKGHRNSKRESLSNFTIVDDVYIVIKWYLETARKHFFELRSEYCDLNQRYSGLSQQSNYNEEFCNYLESQEILRLKLLERIQECKRLIARSDDILYGSLAAALDENSNQSAIERIRVVRRHLNTAVPFDICVSSVSKENIALLKLDLDGGSSPVEVVGTLEESSSSDKRSEQLVASEVPKSTQHAYPTTSNCSTVTECDSTTLLDCKKKKSVSSKRKTTTNRHQPFIRNVRAQNVKRGHHPKYKTPVHKGHKPVKCAQCGRSFRCNAHLRDHRLAIHKPYHTRPYECNICGKRYISRSALDYHKRRGTHPEKQFSCTTCGRTFKRHATRNRHLRTDHRIVTKSKHISDKSIPPHVGTTNYLEHVVPNYTDEDFIRQFRLSREVTYQLISQFSEHEIYTSLYRTNGRRVLSPEKHVLTFLCFVGHQTKTYLEVADIFNVTLSSIHNIITRVSDFILTLSNTVIRVPNDAEKRRTSEYFLNQNGYPGAIGAIISGCIKIDPPQDNPDSHSIQLRAVVNELFKFIYVIIGYPGAIHDAKVFCNSDTYGRLDEMCAGGYHILGDDTFPQMCNVIIPHKDNGHLTTAQKSFNEKHSSCRVMVENVFRILKQRFPQLYHMKLYRIDRMVKIIHACCILHNIASIDDVRFFDPPMLDSSE